MWFAPLFLARQDVRSPRRHHSLRRSCSQRCPVAGRSGGAPGDGAQPRKRDKALGITWSRATGNISVPVSDVRSWPRYRRAARRSCRPRCPSGRHFLVGSHARRDASRGASRLSTADLRARHRGRSRLRSPLLDVTIRPYAQDTHPSARQTLLRLTCSRAAGRRRSSVVFQPWRVEAGVGFGVALGDRPRRTAFVLGITAAWWLLAPLQVDDGWVRARR